MNSLQTLDQYINNFTCATQGRNVELAIIRILIISQLAEDFPKWFYVDVEQERGKC